MNSTRLAAGCKPQPAPFACAPVYGFPLAVRPSSLQSGPFKFIGWNGPADQRKEDDMTTTNQKPAKTLRDGNIKITIWRNISENGPWYSVQSPIRSYQDEAEEWQETSSLSGSDVLKAAHLLTRAYDAVATLRANDRQEAGQ